MQRKDDFVNRQTEKSVCAYELAVSPLRPVVYGYSTRVSDRVKIGRVLAELRERATPRVTQDDIRSRMGLANTSSISSIESGSPRSDSMLRYLDALGLSLYDLAQAVDVAEGRTPRTVVDGGSDSVGRLAGATLESARVLVEAAAPEDREKVVRALLTNLEAGPAHPRIAELERQVTDLRVRLEKRERTLQEVAVDRLMEANREAAAEQPLSGQLPTEKKKA
jgi:hypothetical protein